MKRLNTKVLFLFFFGLLGSAIKSGFAQENVSSDVDKAPIGILVGINGGIDNPNTDLQFDKRMKPLYGAQIGYQVKPYLALDFSFQKGVLGAGNNRPGTPWFRNSFYSTSFMADFYPMAFNKHLRPYIPQIFIGPGID